MAPLLRAPQARRRAPRGAPEDRGQIVHARVPLFRQHSVQALRGPCDLECQPFEADGSVDEIAQDQPGHLWFTVEEQGRSLIEQCFGKIGIALHSFYDRLFEIAGQSHLVYLLPLDDRRSDFRLLYSEKSIVARSTSELCLRFGPPPSSIHVLSSPAK